MKLYRAYYGLKRIREAWLGTKRIRLGDLYILRGLSSLFGKSLLDIWRGKNKANGPFVITSLSNATTSNTEQNKIKYSFSLFSGVRKIVNAYRIYMRFYSSLISQAELNIELNKLFGKSNTKILYLVKIFSRIDCSLRIKAFGDNDFSTSFRASVGTDYVSKEKLHDVVKLSSNTSVETSSQRRTVTKHVTTLLSRCLIFSYRYIALLMRVSTNLIYKVKAVTDQTSLIFNRTVHRLIWSLRGKSYKVDDVRKLRSNHIFREIVVLKSSFKEWIRRFIRSASVFQWRVRGSISSLTDFRVYNLYKIITNARISANATVQSCIASVITFIHSLKLSIQSTVHHVYAYVYLITSKVMLKTSEIAHSTFMIISKCSSNIKIITEPYRLYVAKIFDYNLIFQGFEVVIAKVNKSFCVISNLCSGLFLSFEAFKIKSAYNLLSGIYLRGLSFADDTLSSCIEFIVSLTAKINLFTDSLMSGFFQTIESFVSIHLEGSESGVRHQTAFSSRPILSVLTISDEWEYPVLDQDGNLTIHQANYIHRDGSELIIL